MVREESRDIVCTMSSIIDYGLLATLAISVIVLALSINLRWSILTFRNLKSAVGKNRQDYNM